MSMYEQIEEFRREYNRLGLHIFETFEEYMEDKLELIEDDSEH